MYDVAWCCINSVLELVRVRVCVCACVCVCTSCCCRRIRVLHGAQDHRAVPRPRTRQPRSHLPVHHPTPFRGCAATILPRRVSSAPIATAAPIESSYSSCSSSSTTIRALQTRQPAVCSTLLRSCSECSTQVSAVVCYTCVTPVGRESPPVSSMGGRETGRSLCAPAVGTVYFNVLGKIG